MNRLQYSKFYCGFGPPRPSIAFAGIINWYSWVSWSAAFFHFIYLHLSVIFLSSDFLVLSITGIQCSKKLVETRTRLGRFNSCTNWTEMTSRQRDVKWTEILGSKDIGCYRKFSYLLRTRKWCKNTHLALRSTLTSFDESGLENPGWVEVLKPEITLWITGTSRQSSTKRLWGLFPWETRCLHLSTWRLLAHLPRKKTVSQAEKVFISKIPSLPKGAWWRRFTMAAAVLKFIAFSSAYQH